MYFSGVIPTLHDCLLKVPWQVSITLMTNRLSILYLNADTSKNHIKENSQTPFYAKSFGDMAKDYYFCKIP